MYNFPLSVGNVAETVEVSAATPQMQMETSTIGGTITDKEVANNGLNGRNFTQLMQLAPGVSNPKEASVNVLNLQKRVSGVLPVPVPVPRAGTSFSFVRPLVLDEETKVTFSYKTR
jgi:hypothetical protein